MKPTDISYFESTPAPRGDGLCKQFAPKVDPWWGFLVYGFAYAFLSIVMFMIGLLPAFLIADAVGQPDAAWATALGVAMGFAAFGLSWWAFARWVKRRRLACHPLLRDGQLLTGTVVDKFAASAGKVVKRLALDFAASELGGVKVYRVEVEHDGKRRALEVPVVGFRPALHTKMRVLFHPTAKHALVFDDKGKLQVASVKD